MQTLIDLSNSFATRGTTPAVVYRTGVRRLTWSYVHLHDQIQRLTGWLAGKGLGSGDRVLLWAPNSPWWVVAYFAIVSRGAVVVPVDFMSGRERAETIAGLTGAKLVLQSRFKLDLLSDRHCFLLEDLEYILPTTAPLPPVTQLTAEDLAQLVYTSGTTGNPKGVMLSHGNLMANLQQVGEHLPIVNCQFVFLSLLPLSHLFEQMGGLLIPLAHGSSIVYLRTLKPSAIMEALAEEGVWAVIAVPRLLQMLRGSIEQKFTAIGLGGAFAALRTFGARLPRSWRRRLFFPVQRRFGRHFTLFVSGGAPLAADLFRFWDDLGFTVLEGYGLSECSPVLSANALDAPQAGTVGRSLPGVEVRFALGEVQVRGANVFSGYYQNETATAAAFTADGWFRTGDLGELAADGSLIIKGRQKELIVTGAGVNVYPDELEAVLNRQAGVREACVIGLDRGAGEEVHGVLIMDESGRPAEEVIANANDQLDDLHRITSFSLWPDAEFPKTTTMKVQKFKVRERLKAGVTAAPDGLADRLVALVSRITGAPLAEIGESSRLVLDLGLTSIGRLELVTALEQEYRLDLEDSAVEPSTTLADLRRIIRERRSLVHGHILRLWAQSLPVRLLRMTCDALIHYPLLSLFMPLKARGLEKLAGFTGPVLFIANHQSYLDQPAIMFALPRAIRYRTATAAWEEFFFQNFSNMWQKLWKRATFEYGTVAFNFFPLPQSSGFRRSLQHMGKLIDMQVSILVFPEGERSLTGELLPFQRGLGIIASELRVPVVPVHIADIRKVLPRDGRWPHRHQVTVTFGDPVMVTGQQQADLLQELEAAVRKLALSSR